MDGIETIRRRKSIRSFSERQISQEDIRTILQAGMSGPSCVNSKDWQFVVVQEKELLARMAEGNGRAADPLIGAAAGILVCGDMERAFPKAPDYWVIDGAIAAQNMILAATALGIGSVWLGTYPQESKMAAQRELLHLPKTLVPHSIVAFGYPGEGEAFYPADRDCYDAAKVHFGAWQ